MKKKTFALLLSIVFAAASLTACGADGSSGGSAAAEDVTAKETLVAEDASASENTVSDEETASAAEEETEQDLPEFFDEDEEPTLPPIPDDLTGGKSWIDSSIPGNVTTDTQTSPAGEHR